jgi:hypothetical protein
MLPAKAGKTKGESKMKKSVLTLVLMVAAACFMAAGVAPAATGDGTKLTVTLDTPSVVCIADGSGADVTAGYSVISTGAADAAVLTASIGGVDYPLPTIASGNVATGGGWTFSGRTKTAEGEFTAFLANGEYTITVCAAQNGANDRKEVCSTPAPVTVNCTSPDPCANVGAYGEVPNNKNLCKANGNIEIQFQGSFGDTATLVISGPDFSTTAPVNKNGDSCNYHFNWDPAEDQNPGVYTFTVNDSLTFSADLICDQPGRP